MSKISNIEDKVISGTNQMAQKLVSTLISAFLDYKHRHLGLPAASVSFYVIFSVFPLLAFSVYLVGKMIGDNSNSLSAQMVLTTLRDFVPGMQSWIEKGLFDVVKGNSASSWMNAVLLGWSGVGLFSALLNAMGSLPNDHEHHHRAHIAQFTLAGAMLGLFTAFMSTLMFTEMVNAAGILPDWMDRWPAFVKTIFFYGAKTKILLALVSVGFVMSTYILLCPVKITVRSAFIGSLVFTGLLFLSRSAYWIYIHYNKANIQSSYGIFSTLILIMLWVHFCVSCLMYGCLYGLHLDQANGKGANGHGGSHGGTGGHGGGHGHEGGKVRKIGSMHGA